MDGRMEGLDRQKVWLDGIKDRWLDGQNKGWRVGWNDGI